MLCLVFDSGALNSMNTLDESSASSLKGKQGLERLIAATSNSFRGLQQAWRNEAAFRQECFLLCLFVPAAFWLGKGATEIALLLMSCLIVLITELLNTAVEVVVNRVSLERHELSGRAKDIASAAVFLSLAQVVLVWGIVAWNRFY